MGQSLRSAIYFFFLRAAAAPFFPRPSGLSLADARWSFSFSRPRLPS